MGPDILNLLLVFAANNSGNSNCVHFVVIEFSNFCLFVRIQCDGCSDQRSIVVHRRRQRPTAFAGKTRVPLFCTRIVYTTDDDVRRYMNPRWDATKAKRTARLRLNTV